MRTLVNLPSKWWKVLIGKGTSSPLTWHFVRHLETCLALSWIEDLENQKLLTLDAGSGSGTLTVEFCKRGFETVGIDISTKRLRQAQNLARITKTKKNLSFIVGDLAQIPFKDACFDLIICNSVLEHVKYDLSALCEYSRILKDSGKLFLSVDSTENRFFFKFLDKLPRAIRSTILKKDLLHAKSIEEGMYRLEERIFNVRRRYSLIGLKDLLQVSNLEATRQKYYLSYFGAISYEAMMLFKKLGFHGRKLTKLLSPLIFPPVFLEVILPTRFGYCIAVLCHKASKTLKNESNQTF